MSFLSFGTKEEEVSLLIDIGSSSITIALVLFSQRVPEFLFYSTSQFSITDDPDSQKYINSMLSQLEVMLGDATSKGFRKKVPELGHKSISRVVISFSSPWYISKSKEIKLEQEKYFVITKSFLVNLTEVEEQKFNKELSEDTTNGRNSFQIIEKSIVHVKINGYILKNNLGKKTKALEAFIYLSAIPTYVTEKVIEIVSKHTHIARERVLLHTFPLISFLTIRDSLASSPDFLLVDIGGEVTDISYIKEDVISQNVSFHLGSNFILRQIVKNTKVSMEIAESMLTMYLNKRTSLEISRSIERILFDIEREWAIYFEDALHTFSPNRSYPNEIFVTVDSEVAPIFMDFFKTAKVSATLVNKEILAPLYKPNSQISPDEFVIILADFYSKMKDNQ